MQNDQNNKKASVLQEKIYQLRRQEEEKKAQLLAEKIGLPYINLGLMPINPESLNIVAEADARTAQVAVFKAGPGKAWLAVIDPKDLKTQKLIKALEKKRYQEIIVSIASQHSLEKAWQIYKELPGEQKQIADKVEVSLKKIEQIQGQIKSLEDIKGAIKNTQQLSGLVEIIIAGALKTNASDIHLEKKEKEVLIRYRIDGILHDVVFLSEKIYELILSRIKMLSRIKLNIKDIAQDGRFSIKIKENEIDVRASCLPGSYGENIVMRLLNPKNLLDLKDLGLREDLLAMVGKEIKKSSGMFIIAGPTGSGKTTSLYAFLQKMNQPEIKIITLEDPIEYRLPGIIQTQVETDKGYTFAQGLRASLRQDPDVILVGEIRDSETAQVSLRAASTGHLVFTTLHTNDSPNAVPFLIEFGIKPTFLSSSLNCIMAQRLIRKICTRCQEKYIPSSQELTKIKKGLSSIKDKNIIPKINNGLNLTRGRGCPACLNTGFKGRIGIFEMIKVNENIEKLINSSPSHIQIKELAVKEGLISMYQDGLIKVLTGTTTIEEIERVVG